MTSGKIKIQFSGGQSRHGDWSVNYLMESPNQLHTDERDPLYAEVALPSDCEVSDDYGYMVAKREILRQAERFGLSADRLDFWYDGFEDRLESDAEQGEARGW